ncbi:MAG: hypothetical protein GX868_12110 [Actinobacteria bacterium]|nr:hypothetical protein [Actinomycetota bacterium]
MHFRTNPGPVLMWTLIHAALWSFGGVAFGFVDFVDAWKASLFGAGVGLTQALLQWFTTSVSVQGSTIVSRNLGWTQRVPIDQIEVIQRARHRRWSGVIVKLRDGQEVVLAAPTSSVFSPNPHFDEEVHRLCANIALGDRDDRDDRDGHGDHDGYDDDWR